MGKLKIAIVGAPNVGKSSLFNRLCKQRIAIVDGEEGSTRDRLYSEIDFFGRTLEIIDTGGIDLRGERPFQKEVHRQSQSAIEEADAVIMVVDGIVGPTVRDQEIVNLLLRTKKSVTIAVNKLDDWDKLSLVGEFYRFGIPHLVGVSAVHGIHIAELLEMVLRDLPADGLPAEEMEEAITKIAIVGRPNVGKSTLLNGLLGQERCAVSPLAGTTRDSVDVPIKVEGRPYILIDTAGIRRKHAEHEPVDKFASIRTARAIERADISLLVIDAQEGINAQDKRIAREIEEQGKGCIILLNKWDLVTGYRMEHCLKALQIEVEFLAFCPKIFLSALTGRNLDKIFHSIQEVDAACKRRITTGQLNKFVEETVQKYHPPMLQGRRLRILYLAQVGVAPPTFILFVNQPSLMTESYQQYMMNQFRKHYSFSGAPLRFFLRGKVDRKRLAGHTARD
jgi:GTP-binding protein